MVLLSGKDVLNHKFKKLPKFNLKNIDEKFISSDKLCDGYDGLLVMFICNHCPYVKAIVKNIVQDCDDLRKNLNINFVAINSNDPNYNSEDSFENMKKFAKNHDFSFPYLFDETQEVAKEFDAVCTPDLFLFLKDKKSSEMILAHKGRLNDFIYTKDGKQTSEGKIVQRELYIVAQYLTGKAKNSMGCSIKWKS
jgi:peroxiredoxin